MSTICPDCGFDVPGDRDTCPECGCPIEHKNEESTQGPGMYENQPSEPLTFSVAHDTYNEGEETYSPSYFNWFLKDPYLIRIHPMGDLETSHPFLGWLFNPWHLTPKNEAYRESYDTINNIFYMNTLIFKIFSFAGIWLICKAWWMLFALIAIYAILVIDTYFFCDYIVIFGLILILLIVLLSILHFVALGKALHRYWPKLHLVCRRIAKRFWNYIKSDRY
jgi:hypothetical protein